MPAEITLSHVQAHELLTARLYFQPETESGYLDLGNVQDYKYAPEKTYATRLASDKGFRYINDEQLNTVHDKWEFTLDEQDANNAKLIYLATRIGDGTQTAAAPPTKEVTLEAVALDRIYFIGVRGAGTVVCAVGETELEEGTDYEVDLDSGILTTLSGGTLEAGDDIDITCGCKAITYETFTGRDTVLFRGSVTILEYNQFQKEPLREIGFDGVLRLSAWPEYAGEFAKFTCVATPFTKPRIMKRSAYEAADAIPEGA
jgi:hypothetical protein